MVSLSLPRYNPTTIASGVEGGGVGGRRRGGIKVLSLNNLNCLFTSVKPVRENMSKGTYTFVLFKCLMYKNECIIFMELAFV